MVLGEIVGIVVDAPPPEDNELVLADSVFEPVEPHVHGFGAALADRVVDDAGGASVVGLYGGGRLRVAKVVEGGAKIGAVLGIIEEGA